MTSPYPTNYALRILTQAIDFAEAEQDFTRARKWLKEVAHSIEDDNAVRFDLRDYGQTYKRYTDALLRVTDIAQIIFNVTSTAFHRDGAKAVMCPHGNQPSYPTHAWWCDVCWGKLRDALIELNNAHAWQASSAEVVKPIFYCALQRPSLRLFTVVNGEQFNIKFDDIDEWNAIRLSDGTVYDVHLLIEELGSDEDPDEEIEVSFYPVVLNVRDDAYDADVRLMVAHDA